MELKNNDNIFLDPSTGELTFGKIFKILKFSLLRILVYVLIACIIAGTVSVVLLATAKTDKSVNTTITYTFKGINEGLDPNGNPFNINRVKSVDILDKAITASGLKDKIDANSLQSKINIISIIPSNVLAEINKAQSNANKDPSANKDITEFDYNPNTFTVYLNDYNELDLTANDAKNLLKCVMDSYQQDWIKSYVNPPIISNDFFSSLAELDPEKGDVPKYDFMRYESLLNYEINNLRNFLEKHSNMTEKSSDGVTYLDLLGKLNIVVDNNFNEYLKYVKHNKITNDRQYEVTKLNKELESIEIKKIELNDLVAKNEEALSKIEPTKEEILDEKGKIIKITTYYPEKYYELQDSNMKNKKEIATLNTDANLIKKELKEFEDTPAPTPEQFKEATRQLNVMAKEFLDITTKAQRLTDEYRDLPTPMKIDPIIDSNEKSVSKTSIMATFLVCIVVALIAAIAVTIKSQKKFAFKKLAEKQTSNSVESEVEVKDSKEE